jgi:hypothetical protein
MTKAASRRLLLVVFDQPVMLGEPCQGDLQNDLARPLRPTVLFLSVFEAFQLATDIDSTPATSGPTAMSARITRSFAAMTSSRSSAAFDGGARRERSEGASADQVEVTRGLRWANQ